MAQALWAFGPNVGLLGRWNVRHVDFLPVGSRENNVGRASIGLRSRHKPFDLPDKGIMIGSETSWKSGESGNSISRLSCMCRLSSSMVIELPHLWAALC